MQRLRRAARDRRRGCATLLARYRTALDYHWASWTCPR